jgi:anti-anti-sigma factor
MGSAERGDPAGRASQLADIERRERDGVHALTVSGELDISNVGILREAAGQIPNDARGLVVDLTGATFVDSATVGFLFELKRSLERRGQALQVVCPPGSPAERVLTMTAFDARVRGEPTLEAAIETVRRTVPLGE